MDKTDMLVGPRDYLRRAALYNPTKESTKRDHAARMNAKFGALDAPRDQYVSRVNRAGVTGGGNAPRGISKTQYHRKRFCHVVMTFDTNVGEQRLIKRNP